MNKRGLTITAMIVIIAIIVGLLAFSNVIDFRDVRFAQSEGVPFTERDDGECQSNADCPSNSPFCLPMGVCVECLADSQCSENHFCLAGECQPVPDACGFSYECPYSMICVEGECIGNNCGNNNDCPDEWTCNNVSGYCVPQCAVLRIPELYGDSSATSVAYCFATCLCSFVAGQINGQEYLDCVAGCVPNYQEE